jgi:hypothetical protein
MARPDSAREPAAAAGPAAQRLADELVRRGGPVRLELELEYSAGSGQRLILDRLQPVA